MRKTIAITMAVVAALTTGMITGSLAQQVREISITIGDFFFNGLVGVLFVKAASFSPPWSGEGSLG